MLQTIIFLLTAATAIIHLYVGVIFPEFILVLNGLGYVGLLAAFTLPINFLKTKRKLIAIVMMIYTLITISMYFKDHPLYRKVQAHGDEEVQTQETQIAQPQPELIQEPQTPELPSKSEIKYRYQFDLLGLGSKAIELLLVITLIAYIRQFSAVPKSETIID